MFQSHITWPFQVSLDRFDSSHPQPYWGEVTIRQRSGRSSGACFRTPVMSPLRWSALNPGCLPTSGHSHRMPLFKFKDVVLLLVFLSEILELHPKAMLQCNISSCSQWGVGNYEQAACEPNAQAFRSVIRHRGLSHGNFYGAVGWNQ